MPEFLHDSCPKNYQNTRIFMIFARKIYKIPEFYMIFARKNARILHNNCPKNIFFRNLGARALLPPVSYAYGPLCPWLCLCRTEQWRKSPDGEYDEESSVWISGTGNERQTSKWKDWDGRRRRRRRRRVSHGRARGRHSSARVSTQSSCAVELPVSTLVVLIDGSDTTTNTSDDCRLSILHGGAKLSATHATPYHHAINSN